MSLFTKKRKKEEKFHEKIQRIYKDFVDLISDF